jgi:hypothetical protein
MAVTYTYRFIFEVDYDRIMCAVNIDNRANNPALANQPGSVIQAYNQSQVSIANAPNAISYRIESLPYGNLVGYVVLQIINGVASVLIMNLRPAYLQFQNTINQNISTFISSNVWQSDYLS